MQNSVAVHRKLLPHIAFMTQNACGKYVHRQIDAKRCGKFHAFSKKSEITKKCFLRNGCVFVSAKTGEQIKFPKGEGNTIAVSRHCARAKIDGDISKGNTFVLFPETVSAADRGIDP